MNEESKPLEVRYIQAQYIKKTKERYVQDARERLPQYFSPEKRLSTEKMTIDDYREHGLPKEIYWKMVEYNLSAKDGISVNRVSEISRYIDFLASEYVVYYERIHRDYTGLLLAEQLQQLETVFKRSFDRMANVYTKSVGKFFERNEIKEESTVMQQSIFELYLRKIRQYADFIRLEPDYARIMGTEEEWLLRESYFMGDLLRLIVSKLYTQCVVMPENLYNESDLGIAGAIFESANTWLITQKSTAVSEEQLGIELGLLGMKFNIVLKEAELSTQLREKLSIIFPVFYRYKIEDINKRQQEAVENIYMVQNDLYAPLDEDVVKDWTAKLSLYVTNNNISAVFTEAIPQAFAVFKEKVEQGSKLERYKENNDWYQFYSESETIVHRHSSAFTYKLRLKDWNNFIEKVNIDLKFQHYDKINE